MAAVTNIFTRPRQRLSGFVAVSIIAHLVLLSYWFQSSSPQPITSAPLSVTLLQSQDEQIGATKQTSQVGSEPETAKPAASSADTKSVASQMQTVAPVVTKRQAVITVPAEKPQSEKTIAATMVAERAVIATSFAPPQTVVQLEQPRRVEPSQRQVDNVNKAKPRLSLTQVREQLRGHMHENFARHFHYPRLARKRGWQGEALLNLRIEADGTISHILLMNSSGYSLLDNTAINTVKKIRNVKKISQWLNGRAIEMELPVIYRLTNG